MDAHWRRRLTILVILLLQSAIPTLASSVAIRGIEGYGVYPRLEIRQLAQDADQWNIYLLGLLSFQQTDQSEVTSWYQIAGIHGRPYIPWDNVPPAPGIDSPGYCTHVLNVFANWHRPYLALFEQTLYKHMIAVVNSFPAGSVRDRYAAAIISWRTPYWDWAAEPPAGESVFPSFLQTRTINVTYPNGTMTVLNPLFSYKFHPVSATDFYYDPFAFWNETKRAPTSWKLHATSRNGKVAAALDNNRASFADRLYNLFVNYNNYTEFGNEAWLTSSSVSNADSLESLHDVIHAYVGMNGHMTYLDYSAFDPTFMLHHAMVDRCLALWQVLYPDSFVEPMNAVEQTYTIAINTTETVDSPLEPFASNKKGTFWTAETARNYTTFGYSYPELYPTVDISAVKAAINTLYGSSSSNGAATKRAVAINNAIPGAALDTQTHQARDETSDGRYRQYMANIRSPKAAPNGSYAIYIFVGDFDDEPSTWPTSASLVGTQAVFAGLAQVDAASDAQINATTGILIGGTVPLTTALQAKVAGGALASMAAPIVEAYLVENLHWRIAKFDDSEVPLDEVPGLQILVVSADVSPATAPDEFPTASNYTALSHITRGKLGGLLDG